MSTNPDDRTPIPGAPGFFLPSNLSPEERDAYLLRLRFGPSLFKSGQDVSSAGGDESTAGGATSYPGPGVVNPAIMQGFLKAANTPVEKPLSHSAQMVQRILDVNPDTRGMHAVEDATPEMAIPQNEQEWMAVNQPGGYGYTPQQEADYNLRAKAWGGARQYEKEKGELGIRKAEAESKDTIAEARAKELAARAELDQARAQHPELFNRPGTTARSDRVAEALGLTGGGGSKPGVPPQPADEAAPKVGAATQPPPGFVFDPKDKTGQSIINPTSGARFALGVDPKTGKRGWLRQR